MRSVIGIDDPRGFTLPIWQAWLTGFVFAAVGLIGFHAPGPRSAPIDVLGRSSQARILKAAIEHASPGGYSVQLTSSEAAGEARLLSGSSYALITFGAHPVLRFAGANGPTVTNSLTHVIPAVAARIGVQLAPIDVLPLRKNDTAALPLFYMTFGVVLASYLFAITSSVQQGLSGRGHRWSSTILALMLGSLVALLGWLATETIDSTYVAACAALLALGSLATSAASAVLLRFSRTFGGLLASLLFVVLGSASGGVVPAAFLPGWLAVLRPVLPMGATLSGIRDVVYFGGHNAGWEVAVLAAWALGAFLISILGEHRTATPDKSDTVTSEAST